MWRHEDVWRTLGGGIDFMTGEPLPKTSGSSPARRRGRAHGPHGLAPLIHGNAQGAALMALFAGDTVVILPHFDPDEIWRTIDRRPGSTWSC